MLRLLSSYRHIEFIMKESKINKKIILCKNEKGYLGISYQYIMKILLKIRESKKLFEYLIQSIEANLSTIDDIGLNFLAQDFVFLFFSDFSSSEKGIITILRQFEVIITKMFDEYKLGKHSMLFEDQKVMINKIIKSFLKNNENRDYVNLLFGKLFDEASDLKKYAKKMRDEEATSNDIMLTAKTVYDMPDPKDSKEHSAKLILNHFQIPSLESGFMSEIQTDLAKSQIISIEMDSDEEKIEDIILICDGLLHRIVTKLPYMTLCT